MENPITGISGGAKAGILSRNPPRRSEFRVLSALGFPCPAICEKTMGKPSRKGGAMKSWGYSLVISHSYGKSPCLKKVTISMAIINSYVTNYQRVESLGIRPEKSQKRMEKSKKNHQSPGFVVWPSRCILYGLGWGFTVKFEIQCSSHQESLAH